MDEGAEPEVAPAAPSVALVPAPVVEVGDLGEEAVEGGPGKSLTRPLAKDKARRGVEFYESARRGHAKGMRALEALIERKLAEVQASTDPGALDKLVSDPNFRYALEQTGRFGHSSAPRVGVEIQERRLLIDT